MFKSDSKIERKWINALNFWGACNVSKMSTPTFNDSLMGTSDKLTVMGLDRKCV